MTHFSCFLLKSQFRKKYSILEGFRAHGLEMYDLRHILLSYNEKVTGGVEFVLFLDGASVHNKVHEVFDDVNNVHIRFFPGVRSKSTTKKRTFIQKQ
jgi:hypothetical protein